MKQRSVGIAILLSIITCGIYGIYWLIMLNDETNYVSQWRCGSLRGLTASCFPFGSGFSAAFSNALPSFAPMDLLMRDLGAVVIRLAVLCERQERKEIPYKAQL